MYCIIYYFSALCVRFVWELRQFKKLQQIARGRPLLCVHTYKSERFLIDSLLPPPPVVRYAISVALFLLLTVDATRLRVI